MDYIPNFAKHSDTSVDYLATSGELTAIQQKLEVQVIYQLLISKGIITREEVDEMRNIVAAHSKDAIFAIQRCQARLKRLADQDDFEQNFKSVLNGNATPEQKKAVDEYLNKVSPSKQNSDK